MISTANDPEVRYQVGWINSPPAFGLDVSELRPGHNVVFDADVPGYPFQSLNELPPGDYYVQGLLNVYTRFPRADGHVIWAHMDQWEGQSFSRSPGNLYSKQQRLHIDARHGGKIQISLSEVIPPIKVPPDTRWVKYVKIQSRLLSQFWGHPMYLGAVVLLPRDYESHPDARYPVIYQQGHFNLRAPFEFETTATSETNQEREEREAHGLETGYEFYNAWNSDNFPRAIAVTFLHPTPYFDDSYAVDSANNGPYGTAIMTELVPYIEKEFRIIAEPRARVLVGGSTGGWEALALQLFHPEFFGGAWVLFPDPIDFRRFQLLDIYEDKNAFIVGPRDLPTWGRAPWLSSERSFARADDGQSIATVRQVTRMEAVFGSKGRGGGQLAIWNAVFGPVGEDGYPKPLWNEATGEIDHEVALYSQAHGYDLRNYAETNWMRIGPMLEGKLNLSCGDMDNFYLNLGVYLFQRFLEVNSPYAPQDIEYGRPLKGHGWQPMTNAELVRVMVDRVESKSPPGEKLSWAER